MNTRKFIPLFVLVLAMLACGAPAAGNGTTATPANPGSGSPAPQNEPSSLPAGDVPTPTTPQPAPTEPPIEQIGEYYLLPDGPIPPSDYYEAMQDKLDAGEWMLEQGLVNVLKIYTGELDPAAVFPDFRGDPGEIGQVYQLAKEYLASGEDSGARAEIERMAALIIPDIDRLMEYAVPEPVSATTGGLYLASLPSAPAGRTALQNTTTCADLWKTGFPPGSQAVCFQYTDQALPGGGIGRVFYPAAWYPSDPKMALAKASADALVDSARTFSGFGSFQSVDLIFTELDWILDNGQKALGAANGTVDNPICNIAIFPVQLSTANADGIGVFKQTIAHEAFHCFQNWNFPVIGSGSNSWWVEGSAEYFSNVVYPTVNDEWSRIDDFGMESAASSLFEMDYENTVFFQYLANNIGDAGLIALFESIPAGSGTQGSITTFSDFSGMDSIFQNFGQAFMDLDINDTGGGKLPLRPYLDDAYKKTVVSDTAFSVDTKPFVLRRYLFTFTTDSIYSIADQVTGPSGTETARPAYTRGSWGALPGTVNGGCSEQEYVYLVTTTNNAGEKFKVDFNITHEEDAACDQCLVGHWQLDLPSFADFATRGMYEDDDLSYELNSITGSEELRMYESGYFESVYDDLLVDSTMHFGSPGDSTFDTSILHFTTGRTIGRFWVTEVSKTLVFVANQSNVTLTIAVNGNSGEPKDLYGEMDEVGEGSQYQCEPKVLSILTYDTDGAPAAILYNRISTKP